MNWLMETTPRQIGVFRFRGWAVSSTHNRQPAVEQANAVTSTEGCLVMRQEQRYTKRDLTENVALVTLRLKIGNPIEVTGSRVVIEATDIFISRLLTAYHFFGIVPSENALCLFILDAHRPNGRQRISA
jgi:hypothetical protein